MMRFSFLIFFGCLFSPALEAQPVDTAHWITDGPVYALAQYNGKLYMGGNFSQVSPCTGGFVPTDSANGSVVGWPHINGPVYTTLSDDSGGFYVGGDFSRVGPYGIHSFFHIDAQGAIDLSLLLDPEGAVYTIEKYGNKLYIAGDFTSIVAQGRTRGACFDLAGDSLTPWDPQTDGVIYDMELDSSDQAMAIVGDFQHAGGNQRYSVAKVDITTGHTLNFPNTFGPWALPFVNGPVRKVLICNTTSQAFIGGDFTSIGSGGLVQLIPSTGSITSFNANIIGNVYDIQKVGANLYIAGTFQTVGGYPRNRLACISSTTGILKPWNPSANGRVCRLIPDKGKWYACGDFTVIAGQPRRHIAVMDTSMSYTMESYAPLVNGTVWTAFRDFGRLFIGGSFTGIGGTLGKNLCRLDMTSGVADNWYPEPGQPVHMLKINNQVLFAAGDFGVIGISAIRNHICAFDLSNDQLLPFNPGCDGLVRTMAFSGDTIYMGGNFTTLGGLSRSNLGAVRYSTGTTTPWNPPVTGTVNAIEVTPAGVVVAGYFGQVNSTVRNNIARISPQTAAVDANWDPDADDGIYQLVPYGGNYYLGGWFQHIGSSPAAFLCNLDPATHQPGTFNGQVDDFVRLLHLEGNTLFACGVFNVVQNNSNNGFAAYDLSNGTVRNFNPLFDGTPFALSSTTNTLYVGGSFLNVNDVLQPNLAVIDISSVTGFAAQSNESASLMLFPNPASDVLQITIPANEKGQLLIRDALGRIVIQQEEAYSTSVQLDVSALAAGMYTAEWQSGVGVRVAKFVKR